MSRYIDADALMKEIKMDIADDGLTESLTFYRIMNAPTIDAVSVVRCGECKYGLYTDHNKCYMCNKRGFLMYNDAEFFCSYGERSDNGKDIQSATE